MMLLRGGERVIAKVEIDTKNISYIKNINLMILKL